MIRAYQLLFATMILGACIRSPLSRQQLSCPAGERSFIRDALYFGLAQPSGLIVSDSAWREFLSAVVTPAFPDGFTVVDGQGQWRSASGAVIQEPSKMVLLLHESSPKADAAIAEIVTAYRGRFQQESVLRERSLACVRL